MRKGRDEEGDGTRRAQERLIRAAVNMSPSELHVPGRP